MSVVGKRFFFFVFFFLAPRIVSRKPRDRMGVKRWSAVVSAEASVMGRILGNGCHSVPYRRARQAHPHTEAEISAVRRGSGYPVADFGNPSVRVWSAAPWGEGYCQCIHKKKGGKWRDVTSERPDSYRLYLRSIDAVSPLVVASSARHSGNTLWGGGFLADRLEISCTSRIQR